MFVDCSGPHDPADLQVTSCWNHRFIISKQYPTLWFLLLKLLWLSIIHVKACYHLVGRVSVKVIGGTFLWYSDCLTGVTLLRPRYEESWQETEPSCIDMFQSDWSGQTSHCSLELWSVSIRAKWCIILHFWVECFQDWQIRSCYLVSIRSFNSSKAAHTSGVAQLTTDESVRGLRTFL